MTYKLADVVAATGVPAPTLLSWADRGYIPAAKVGRGNHREFGIRDIDRVAIIAELSRVGLPISESSHAVRAFSDQPNEDRPKGQLHRDGAKTLLVVSEEGASVVRVFDKAAFDDAVAKLYADARTLIVVNVSEVLRRVDAALKLGTSTQKPPAAALFRHGRELAIS